MYIVGDLVETYSQGRAKVVKVIGPLLHCRPIKNKKTVVITSIDIVKPVRFIAR